jgi:tetratricopeptide (TPR) repeat protein
LFFFTFLILFTSCKEKKKVETEETVKIELNKRSVEAFAVYIENALALNNPEPFNDAFDKAYIRKQISDNSIVYSALDTDFGQAFFESNFRQGDKALDVINRGGDFRFVKYYEKDGEHHIIIRIYRDHSIKIDDYIVDTVDGKLKIKDGFSYTASTTLTNQIRCNMLYDVMNRTNPIGPTRYFEEARDLLAERKGTEALKMLETNRSMLTEYPLYTQYYLQSLMQINPKTYLAKLTEMDGATLDHRSVLLSKFLYYVNTGSVAEAQQIATELIEYTGDDPIYLFMFGLANFYDGDYVTALYCHENALTGMRIVWDIWYNYLECYDQLDDEENFNTILEMGKELYGLSDDELKEISKEVRNKS